MLQVSSISVDDNRQYVIMKLTNGEEVHVPAPYIVHASTLLKNPPRVTPTTLCKPCNEANTFHPKKDNEEQTNELPSDVTDYQV
jgi:hypothetical protein